MSASPTRNQSGTNGQQSQSTNLADAASDLSFSNETRWGTIEVSGWYLVALGVLVAVVVL